MLNEPGHRVSLFEVRVSIDAVRDAEGSRVSMWSCVRSEGRRESRLRDERSYEVFRVSEANEGGIEMIRGIAGIVFAASIGILVWGGMLADKTPVHELMQFFGILAQSALIVGSFVVIVKGDIK